MEHSPQARLLIELLRHKLIPWAQSSTPIVLLSVPPRSLGIGQIVEQPAPILPNQHGYGQVMRIQAWAAEDMNSLSMPHFGCIVDGEADIAMGVTDQMAKRYKTTGKRWTVAMPRGAFFIAAPGVPISGGQKVHWERAHPEHAHSRILWVKVHETGVSTHLSISQNNKLSRSPYLFIRSQQILPLANTVIHELEFEPPQYVPIMYLNLTLILQCMLRGLLNKEVFDQWQEAPSASTGDSDWTLNEVCQKAIDYINQNIIDANLKAEDIASHVHMSPVHLRRIFRKVHDMPLMSFVTRQRMILASQLLLQSSFNVKQVAMHCGYKSLPSFINAFIKHHGISPHQFRIRNS